MTQIYPSVKKNPLQLEFVLLIEIGKDCPFADVILCQRVFIPDEFSHVGLVEHNYGHGIYSPTILCGLCCHTKTLRREIVFKKNCTKRILLNNRGVVAILCKNTTCRCSNNKTPHSSVSEISTGSEVMSSSADPTASWLGKLTRGTSAME